MSYDRDELIAADYEYKRAMTAFLAEEGYPPKSGAITLSLTLKEVADELAKFNRNFPTLIQEMASLRGSIDRMPRR